LWGGWLLGGLLLGGMDALRWKGKACKVSREPKQQQSKAVNPDATGAIGRENGIRMACRRFVGTAGDLKREYGIDLSPDADALHIRVPQDVGSVDDACDMSATLYGGRWSVPQKLLWHGEWEAQNYDPEVPYEAPQPLQGFAFSSYEEESVDTKYHYIPHFRRIDLPYDHSPYGDPKLLEIGFERPPKSSAAEGGGPRECVFKVDLCATVPFPPRKR